MTNDMCGQGSARGAASHTELHLNLLSAVAPSASASLPPPISVSLLPSISYTSFLDYLNLQETQTGYSFKVPNSVLLTL